MMGESRVYSKDLMIDQHFVPVFVFFVYVYKHCKYTSQLVFNKMQLCFLS